MCGIFGFWLNRKLDDDDIRKGDLITKTLEHRGPDSQKNWYDKDKGIYFGFRRLAIIDLSENSNQPIVRGNTSLIFNGEIYNFKDLKNYLLTKKYSFQSTGDGEVLLNIWKELEIESLKKIDGMYAFAIYHNQKLNLVTDNFGEKPLFYLINNEGLYFSSEIKQLLSISNCKLDVTNKFYSNFIKYGYDVNFNTGYNNIKLIPPATVLEFNNPKKLKEIKYWKLEKIKQKELRKNFYSNDYKKLKSLLIESINLRLISDVPIGLFLSSGIDSSLIASIVKKELNYDLDTYTVSFSENDESYLAAKIAKYLKLKHNVINTKSDNFYTIQNLLSVFDFPNDNLTSLSIYLMSNSVKKKIKVALNGLGGDEAFFGYNKYKFVNSNQLINRIPKYFKNFILFTRMNYLFNSKKVNNFFKYLSYDNERKYLFINNRLSSELYKKNIDNNELYEFKDDFLKSIINFEKNITLPMSYALANDLGSMRASIETRSPFLSKKLFEFTNQFDLSCFFKNGNKTPLRDLLKDYLPENLINQSKKGFNVPNKNFSLSDNDFFNKLINNTDYDFKNDLSIYSVKDKNRISLRFKIIDEFIKNYGKDY